jgi:hypothetical protein
MAILTSILALGLFIDQAYTLQDKGPGYLMDVSPSGKTMVGMTTTADGIGFVFTEGKPKTYVKAPGLQFRAVNDSEFVTGCVYTAPSKALSWLRWKGITYLNFSPEPPSAITNAVNRTNLMVGMVHSSRGHLTAFKQTAAGVTTLLLGDPLSTTLSSATCVSNSGLVGGYVMDNGGYRAGYWRGRGFNPIPTPSEAQFNAPIAILDDGTMVGFSWQRDGNLQVTWEHGYVWTPSTGYEDIAPLESGHRLQLLDVNSQHVAVGVGRHKSGSTWSAYAVKWTRTGGLQKLSDLVTDGSATGWVLDQTQWIDDSGRIYGNGTYKGARRMFMLTPVPNRPL